MRVVLRDPVGRVFLFRYEDASVVTLPKNTWRWLLPGWFGYTIGSSIAMCVGVQVDLKSLPLPISRTWAAVSVEAGLGVSAPMAACVAS